MCCDHEMISICCRRLAESHSVYFGILTDAADAAHMTPLSQHIDPYVFCLDIVKSLLSELVDKVSLIIHLSEIILYSCLLYSHGLSW